jgi:hypothetical protein
LYKTSAKSRWSNRHTELGRKIFEQFGEIRVRDKDIESAIGGKRFAGRVIPLEKSDALSDKVICAEEAK